MGALVVSAGACQLETQKEGCPKPANLLILVKKKGGVSLKAERKDYADEMINMWTLSPLHIHRRRSKYVSCV